MNDFGNYSYAKLKDFQKEYSENGAYHFNAKGFKSWWLTDNYKMLASFTSGEETILDVACGEGCLAGYLESANRLYGLDMSEAAIDFMPDQYRSKYKKLCVGNMLHLDRFFSIKDEIDTIICSLSLMYLLPADVNLYLKKISQLLMPGGKFIFSYPNVFPGVRDANPEAAELTWTELDQALASNGFIIKERLGISGFIPKKYLEQSENDTDNRIFNLYLEEREKVIHNPDFSYHYIVLSQNNGGKYNK